MKINSWYFKANKKVGILKCSPRFDYCHGHIVATTLATRIRLYGESVNPV